MSGCGAIDFNSAQKEQVKEVTKKLRDSFVVALDGMWSAGLKGSIISRVRILVVGWGGMLK